MGGTSGKEPACQCRLSIRDSGSIPGSEKSPGGGHSNPLQYSCMENPMIRGAYGLQSISRKESDTTEVTEHYTRVNEGLPGSASVKNPSAKAGDIRDMVSIPGSGRSPGGGHGNLLQYSCLENPLNRGV